VRVVVRLHAGVRERAGRPTLEVEVGEGARVRDVRDAVERACPGIAGQLGSCRWALRDAFVAADAPVPPGAPLDVIPPVSGG